MRPASSTFDRPPFAVSLFIGPVSCAALFLTLGAFLALANEAKAGDGVVEINQTCAVNGGCFPGDLAGFPVTLDGSAGHSYLLTSDLVVPNANTNVIQVAAQSISIDLGGFEIIRAGCENAQANCAVANGSGNGVARSAIAIRGTSVSNGSIIGMGFSGVVLGEQATVRNLRVRFSRLSGVLVDVGSVVEGCTAYQNGQNGITAGAGSTISGNSVYRNAGFGIGATSSNILDNTAVSNTSGGILAFTHSNIRGNMLTSNGGFALNLDATTSYRDNAIGAVGANSVTGGVDAGGNVCNGSTTCP